VSASNRPCKVCGSTFHGQGKFCSAECLKIGHNRGRPRRQVGVTCKTCDKVFGVPVSRKNKRMYCSVECSHAAGTPQKAGRAGFRSRSRSGKVKADLNQKEIVDAFIQMGAQVMEMHNMGGGFPDLVVCIGGISHLVEVKNRATSYGKRGLNPLQKEFAEQWQGGPVYLVYTVEDAANLVGGRFDAVQSFGGYRAA